MSTVANGSTRTYQGNDKLLFGIIMGVIAFWLFAQTTLNIAPDMSRDLGMTANTMNIAVAITALFSGIFIVVMGGVGDRVGHMKVVRWGFYLNITNDLLASLEYGVAVLHASVILVLGHTRCGAVSAAVNSFENQTQFPGHIQTVITALLPAVRSAAATSHTGTLAEAATLENIRQNVARLAEATPILSSAVRDNHLKVIGGIYDLGTGRVDLLS